MTLAGTALTGCHFKQEKLFDDSRRYFQEVATSVEFPDATLIQEPAVHGAISPHTLTSPDEMQFWDLTLDEAIRIALDNSQVMRDIGGRVVSPLPVNSSIYDAAMAEANPLTGTEAALSAFDAQFDAGIIFARNERTFNNIFFGGGVAAFVQNRGDFQAQISKQSAVGTQYAFRNITNYDRNNSPVNRFRSAYETMLEGEFRHPLLQGAGIEFNRIAGPGSRPGMYNGVLLARINTDVALSDFEIGVRDLVRDVEQTYWDLYFAYRDMDAKKTARDAALEIWRYVERRRLGGVQDPAGEALARGQYFAAQAILEDSLGGTRITGLPGLYSMERQLRRLLGLPATDGRLIRPSQDPLRALVRFDWNESLTDAFWRRPELRRQQWQVRRRELELTAARNFRLMRLDLVGLYRWRGFGDDLLGNRDAPLGNGSAFADLFTGDLQEWETGLQLSTPIGNRLAFSAIRHAELQLARERALHVEQERQVSYDVSEAFANLDRAYTVAQTNYNRREAFRSELSLKVERFLAGDARAPIDFVLDALQRLTVADQAYYRSLADYNLALMEIHVARGTSLDVHGVELAEGPWSSAAYGSAAKQARRFGPPLGPDCYTVPRPMTIGTYRPWAGPFEEVPAGEEASLREEESLLPPGELPTPEPMPPLESYQLPRAGEP
jgi:outer membrane protein TolC